MKKKSAPSTRNSDTSHVNPPGASVVLQKSNFQNTYTINETSRTGVNTPNQDGRPPRPTGGRSNTTVKKGTPTSRKYLNVSGSPGESKSVKTDNTRDTSKKTTSFSRVKRNDDSSNMYPSIDNEYINTSRGMERSNHGYNGVGTPVVKQSHVVPVISKSFPKNSSLVDNTERKTTSRKSTSQRLFAALEYSDHSSDEGSGHFDNIYPGMRGSHMSYVMSEKTNDDHHGNGYSDKRYIIFM